MLDDEFDLIDDELYENDTFGDSFDDEDFEMFLEDEDLEGLDFEGDEFWGGLKKIASKVGSAAKSAAKKLAPLAKRHAGKIGGLIGGAIGGPAGAAIGGRLGSVVQNLEDEDEVDTEDEMEAPLPIAPLDESLAESMAAAASKSSPADARALGGALAITVMSKTPLTVKTVAPGIASASGRIAQSMATTPASRQLIKALPTIVQRTAATLNRKAQKGKPLTRATAARVMTKQARRTLGSPARLAQALAKNAAGKRRLDSAAIARAERFY